ncbi:Van Gogh 2 [Schistosoma japonicum]|nr:Van Gogh 2 [Schistosoma japonicum]
MCSVINSDNNYMECHKLLRQGKRTSKNLPSDWSDNEEMGVNNCNEHKMQYCLHCVHKLLILLEILTMCITFLSPFLMLILSNIHPSWLFSTFPSYPALSTNSPNSQSKVIHKRDKVNFEHLPSHKVEARTEVYYEVKIIEMCTKLLLFSVCLSHIYLSRFRKLLFCIHNKHDFISHSRLIRYKRFKKSDVTKSASSLAQLCWPHSKTKQSLAFNFFIDSVTVIITFSFWLLFLSNWNSNNITVPSGSSNNGENLNYKLKACGNLQHTIQLMNPFDHRDPNELDLCDKTKTLYIKEQLKKLNLIALDLSIDFVNIHLFLQLTAIFLLNFKTILDWLSCKYNVHVVRAHDGVSRNYKIGSVNLKSIAVYIIQNSLIDFQPYDPFVARHKRHSRYNQSIYSDCLRSNTNSTNGDNRKSKLQQMLKNESQEDMISKQKPTSSTQNKNDCHSKQFIKSLQNNPLCFRYNSSSTVAATTTSGLTDNSTNKTNNNTVKLNVDCNDECTEEDSKKLCETFDFLKMPDINELNVQAAKRLKSEISYLKYKRKCQIRLIALINNLFNTVYTKSDFTVNTVESSSDNQLQKSSEFVFQKFFGPISKYLRLTKQHTYHTRSMILNRLKTYLQYNMSAESFLSIYFNPPNEFFYLQYYQHQYNDKILNSSNKNNKDKKCQKNNNHLKFWKTSMKCSTVNQSNQKLNIKTETHSNTKVFQTWKLKLCDPLINSSIYDGFRFELVRSNVKLFCIVKQFSMFQLVKTSLPLWWSGLTYEHKSTMLPPSTVETCIGSSENAVEIKL